MTPLKSTSPAGPRRVTVLKPRAWSLSIHRHLAELWHYRDLLYTLTLHRINVRYKQSALGLAWAVVQPLALMLIYTLIFSYIAGIPTNGTPYAVFTFTALVIWTLFANSLTTGTNALVSHAQIITKVYFPREILPITYVIAALFDFMIAAVILLGLLAFYHVALTLNLLFVIPIVATLVVFSIAITFFFSALQVKFRDIGMAMPLLLQLWMFATPVVYPLSALDKFPPLVKDLYAINPMVGLVENFRRVVIAGQSPDTTSLLVAAGISVVLFIITYAYFKRVDATVADIV